MGQQARSKNIIIFNACEPVDNAIDNSDIKTVNSIIGKLGVDVKPISISRLGKPNNKARPLKVMLKTTLDVFKILGASRQIRADQAFSTIRISSDKTLKQRQYFQDLRSQLANRTSKGEKDLTIKYIKGQPTIVCTTDSKN